jgi:hypothetical protein
MSQIKSLTLGALVILVWAPRPFAVVQAADGGNSAPSWTFPSRPLVYGWLPRGGGASDNEVDGRASQPPLPTIVNDQVLYRGRWRSVIRRSVQHPTLEQELDFEIVSQNGASDQAVTVVVWNSTQQTVTLVREYMPAPHAFRYGPAAGMVEHTQYCNENEHGVNECSSDLALAAAKAELAEECRLEGGQWVRVTTHACTMDKYSTTRIHLFLVIDPQPLEEESNHVREAEEHGMQVVSGISVERVYQLIQSGDLTIVGGWSIMLALNKLQELGYMTRTKLLTASSPPFRDAASPDG